MKVVSEYAGKQYHLRTYRFNYISDPIEVPYCSWANLDCCGGWSFDEEYLDTAVQKGLKLFAGRDTSLRHEYAPNAPTLEDAQRQFEVFKGNLPSGVFADIDTQPDCDLRSFHTFICRTGKISDYIDLIYDFRPLRKVGVGSLTLGKERSRAPLRYPDPVVRNKPNPFLVCPGRN